MDDLHIGDVVIPASELDERFDTSGGPGGQHSNRNETLVRLRWRISQSSVPGEIRLKLTRSLGDEIEVTAGDTRSQHRNREIARERLIERIQAALIVEKRRRATKPTKASKTRRLETKKARGDTKRGRRRPSMDD